jgi:hypothetical protein
MTKQAMKEAVKEALAETLHEHRALLHDVLAEVMEEFALAEAIQEGCKTKPVSRREVFRALRGES